VKGYAAHERGTLDAVITARSKATALTIDPSKITPEQMKQFSQAQVGLSQALGKLFALAEAYPDLKANQNFLELQKELSDTENKIQAARRFYNGNVRDLNIKIESFPSNLIANIFKFAKKEFFDIPDTGPESQPVQVKF
jgi:LemA protein